MKKRNLLIMLAAIVLASCTDSSNNQPKEEEHATEHKHQEDKEHGHHKEGKHGHNHANKHMHQNDVKDLIQSFESEDRAATQKPYEVIALFGDLADKKILDIGSGSGYFTFKLAEKGANVIAGDVSDEFHDYIRQKMKENDISAEKIDIRKLPYDSPSLSPEEIDGAIIVNTYHHIEDRVAYFGKVKKGLTSDGMLMVVDFMKKKFKEGVDGPPFEMRLPSSVVITELEKAGFGKIEVDDTLLPYQYIVKAWKN